MPECRCTTISGCIRGCVYLIEPVVGVFAFATFMTYPLLQQYVYRRLWLQLSGAPYPSEQNNIHCVDNTTNMTSTYVEVQREASLFFLYTELCFLFPSLLSSPLLVSYSDYRGRKAAIVPPLVGDLVFALSYLFVSGLSLSLNYLLGAAFFAGLLGGPAALIGACFAYIADRCERRDGVGGVGGICGGSIGRGDIYEEAGNEKEEEGSDGNKRKRRGAGAGGTDDRVEDRCEEMGDRETGCGGDRGNGRDRDKDTIRDRGVRGRMVRMAGLDMILGLLSGLASLCTGFFIQAAGFTWPFFVAALLHLLNLAYVLGVLQESLSPSPLALSSSSSSSSNSSPSSPSSNLTAKVGRSWIPKREILIGQLQGVRLLFATGTRRRNTVLGLMLAAFAIYKVSKLGGMSIFILYELNKPLCWSEVYVGYGSALTAGMYLGSFAGVSLLSHCLRDVYIVLLGLLSVSAGLLMAAFAKNTLLMFLVRLPMLLSIMPTPVLRAMMSKAVLSSEQGAVFACIAFVEMLSVGVALTVFNSTYAATVSWFPGFSFLLASCLTLIPAVLIGVLMCFHLDEEEEDMSRLTAEPDTDSSRETLNLPRWESQYHTTQ